MGDMKTALKKQMQAQEQLIRGLSTEVQNLQKQLARTDNSIDIHRIRYQLDLLLSGKGNNNTDAAIPNFGNVRIVAGSNSKMSAAALSAAARLGIRRPIPPEKQHRLILNTGNEATEEEQQFCSIASIGLEAEWIEQLLSLPLEKEQCKPVPEFVKVSDGSLVMTGCDGGSIKVTWLDPATTNWTHAELSSSMPLPSESGLATCSKKGQKDIFNLWVEFVPDHTLESPPPSARALDDGTPNIVVFFVDSLAAARLSREMPKTKEVLMQAQRGEFKSHAAFTFKRFNVIKGGTQNNAPALLGGYDYASLPEDMTLPWLFDIYRDIGYVTGIIEMDSVEGKSSLARIRRKTHSKAGDIGDDIKWLARNDAVNMAHHVLSNVFDLSLERMSDPDISSYGTSSPKLCFGGKYLHSYSLPYVRSLLETYPTRPKFVFYAPMELHEPSMRRGVSVDDDFAKELTDILTTKPNTLVIFMGDHGLGYGPWQESKVARLEEKMPTLWWLVPESLLKLHSSMRDGLKSNENRLVTSYDQHYSLIQLALNFPKKIDEKMLGGKHGLSLFEPVPDNRTCQQAHIPVEWCACVEFSPLSQADLDGTLAVSLAQMALTTANTAIEAAGATTCRPLVLEAVTEASRLSSEVLADGITADAMLRLRFSTRGNEAEGITPEVFSINYYGSFHGKEAVLPVGEDLKKALPLEKMLVGGGFNTETDVFEQQGLVAVPRRDENMLLVETVPITCTETWSGGLPKTERMLLRWINPKGAIYAQSVHKLEQSWTSSWQQRQIPLMFNGEDLQGEWHVELWHVTEWDGVDRSWGKALEPRGIKLGDRFGQSSFLLYYRNIDVATGLAAPVPSELLSKFWVARDMRRESSYAKHQGCADGRVAADLCVCPI